MDTQDVQVFEFTLLNPGSIFDMFQSGRKFYGPRAMTSPLSLPEDPKRCVHLNYAVGDVAPIRCEALADHYAQNGWLCAAHNTQLGNQVRNAHQVRHRDKESELVESIIGTEARAIAKGTREKVRLLTKGVYINYLT